MTYEYCILKVEGIIFDWGFTLFYFENPSVQKYYKCFDKGLEKALDLLIESKILKSVELKNTFVKKFRRKSKSYFRESIKSQIEYPTSLIFKEVLEEILSEIEVPFEKFFQRLANLYHSCEAEEWKPYPNTKATLKTLKQKNLKLALLSNHSNHFTVENVLKNYGMLPFFDTIITSAIVGKRKPGKEAFFYTLRELGIKKAESVMVVGDEYADVVGGKRAGLIPVLYKRKYQFPYEKEINIPNLLEIKDISEILELIEK